MVTAVLIIFPVILQTVINLRMLTIPRTKPKKPTAHVTVSKRESTFYCFNDWSQSFAKFPRQYCNKL